MVKTKLTKQATQLQKRAEMYDEYQESGKTVAEWCGKSHLLFQTKIIP